MNHWLEIPVEQDRLKLTGIHPVGIPCDPHVTVAFFGRLTADQFVSVVRCVANVPSWCPEFRAKISGTGDFLLGTKHFAVALIDSWHLCRLRQEIEARLAPWGVRIDRTHGYQPHVTLCALRTPTLDRTVDFDVTEIHLCSKEKGKDADRQVFKLRPDPPGGVL